MEDIRKVGIRRPYGEVDIRRKEDNRDSEGIPACVGAFRKVLARILVVEVDIPEAEWRHLPPEEILHDVRMVEEEDNRREAVGLAYMGGCVDPGDLLLPLVVDVAVAVAVLGLLPLLLLV